jgi:hypothetical protein
MKQFIAAAIAGLAVVVACASPATQHQRLEAALERTSSLSNEIISWRDKVSGTVGPKVVETVKSFKDRAEDLKDEIKGLADEAPSNGDIPAVTQALETLAEFDVHRFDETAPEGMATLLDQFKSAAMDVKTAVARAQRTT